MSEQVLDVSQIQKLILQTLQMSENIFPTSKLLMTAKV